MICLAVTKVRRPQGFQPNTAGRSSDNASNLAATEDRAILGVQLNLTSLRSTGRIRRTWVALGPCLAIAAAFAIRVSPAQAQTPPPLPDAPSVRHATRPSLPSAGACRSRTVGGNLAAIGSAEALYHAGFGDVDSHLGNQPFRMSVPCPIYVPIINWYARFANGPQVKPLTPKEKAWLAIRNVSDPFNAVTILGTSAISVAADSHSPYGPGFPGFGKSVGVAYAEDMTGEFIGTYLIPSIVHQDPHYHREPDASIFHRALHCATQIVWTQGDNGKGMVNFADLVGFAIDDEIANLYVPGRQTDLPASAQRYAIGLALAPTDNLITEFLPDVARRIHIRVIFIQRIINQVAKTDNPGTS